MSEAVHVGTNPADPSKPFLQPALAIKPLSDEGLPSGQETVRLNKPASRKLPPPLFHTLSDFLKHVGVSRDIIESGAKLICLTALDRDANPVYDRHTAQRLADLGAHVGAMTPEMLGDFMGKIMQ